MVVALVLSGCRQEPTPRPDPTSTPPTGDTGTPIVGYGPPIEVDDGSAAAAALTEEVRAVLDSGTTTALQVVVTKGGVPVYSHTFGPSDPDGGDRATPETRFQIGSDTKKITAIAVLQAVDRGELSLDDTLDAVIPDFELARDPDWDDTVTIRHLLTHQAGLFDTTPWDDAPDDADLRGRLMGDFSTHEYVMAPPGAFWNYANPNYSVLGLVVEEVTGRSYADVVTEDIFRPLGMSTTHARKADLPADSWATGYGYVLVDPGDPYDAWSGGAVYDGLRRIDHADEADNAQLRPAGMVWSTAWDQAILANFLIHGDPAVLSEASREVLTTGAVVPNPPYIEGWNNQYAMGLWVSDHLTLFDLEQTKYPTREWSHGGNTLTFTSLTWLLPDQDFSVTVLGNAYGGYYYTISERAMLGFADLTGGSPTVYPAVTTYLDSYVGEWHDPNSVGDVRVELDGDTLSVWAPDFDALGITYSDLVPGRYGHATWTIGGVPQLVSWLPGEDGTTRYLRNRMFVGDAEAPAARRRPSAAPTGPRPVFEHGDPRRERRP